MTGCGLTLTARRSEPAGLTETFSSDWVTAISVFTTTLLLTANTVEPRRTSCIHTTTTFLYYYTPLTRYNLLSNRLSNRFDNRQYRVNKHQPDWQLVGCLFTRYSRLSNQLSNRLNCGCSPHRRHLRRPACARPARAMDMQQQQQQFATGSRACRTFCGQQCVYLESSIKNDLNLSGGLVLRVVTHSLIGLDWRSPLVAVTLAILEVVWVLASLVYWAGLDPRNP